VCSNGRSVPRSLVEQHILESVVARLLDPDAITEALRVMRAEVNLEFFEPVAAISFPIMALSDSALSRVWLHGDRLQ
jgi:hypothetical protein